MKKVSFCLLITTLSCILMGLGFAGCGEENKTPLEDETLHIKSISLVMGQVIKGTDAIIIVFNQALDPTSVNQQNITINGEGIEELELRVDGSKITCVPPEKGFPQGEYTLVISGIRDQNGSVMEETWSRSFSVDNEPPRTIGFSSSSSYSAINGKIIEAEFSLEVRFSEKIDALSVSSSTLSISWRVKGEWKLKYTGLAANWKPLSGQTIPKGEYTLSVTGVKDKAGNVMSEVKEYSFSVPEDLPTFPGQ